MAFNRALRATRTTILAAANWFGPLVIYVLVCAALIATITRSASAQTAPTYRTGGSTTETNPLPVKLLCWSGSTWTPCPNLGAATPTPLAGVDTTAGAQDFGPFTPQLGRAIWLTLSGTWSGTTQVLRSTDGGTTRLPLTIAGGAWGSFTANCNEPVTEESDAAATYYLRITLTSGSATYRMAQ